VTTNSILWTYAITQKDVTNVDPVNHAAKPGVSFSPDDSHVFVLILMNDGIVNLITLPIMHLKMMVNSSSN
jgi:hypothetical protein